MGGSEGLGGLVAEMGLEGCNSYSKGPVKPRKGHPLAAISILPCGPETTLEQVLQEPPGNMALSDSAWRARQPRAWEVKGEAGRAVHS